MSDTGSFGNTGTDPGDDFFADLTQPAGHGPLWPVSDLAGEVLDLYQQGLLPAAVAGQALQALVVDGPDDVRWSLGATTRSWYRSTRGGPWQMATAPTTGAALQGAAEAAVQRALAVLEIDPATVPERTDPAAAPTQPAGGPEAGSPGSGAPGGMSLLDSLLEGFGS